MRYFSLTPPLEATKDERKALAEAGIMLEQTGGKRQAGFNRMSVNMDFAEAMSHLQPALLNRVMLHSRDKDFIDLGLDAIRHGQLRAQKTQAPDDFQIPHARRRPMTWPLEDKLMPEISRLSRKLAFQGIVSTEVGLESEFVLEVKPVAGSTLWLELKKEILADLEKQEKKMPTNMRDGILDKRDAIYAFGPREILMFDMVERDKRTRSLLQPMFGHEYYDARDVPELKTLHQPALRALEDHKVVSKVLHEKAAAFGLMLHQDISHHVNVSFHTHKGNVFEEGQPAMERAVTEGMARGMFEMLPLIADERTLAEPWPHDTFDVGFGRGNYLRRAEGRMEIRLSAPPDQQHISMVVAAAMASALYGLTVKDEHTVSARLADRPLVAHHEPLDQRLAHLVSGGMLDRDGRLFVTQRYLDDNAEHIGFSLGLRKDLPGKMENLFRIPCDYLPGMKEFFSRTRIEDDGKIVWPRNDGGRFRIDMPKDVPPLHINVAALEKKINGTGIATHHVVAPGYRMNRGDVWNEPKDSLHETRMDRMRNSDVAKYAFSPNFHAAFLAVMPPSGPEPRQPETPARKPRRPGPPRQG